MIVFASIKGGVGKTAGAVFLSRAIAAQGTHVTLIDGDPNNCATDYFLRETAPEVIAERDLYHALMADRALADCILTAGGISIIPATPALAHVGIELVNDPGVAIRFPRDVRALASEVVIIDTPPSLTLELTLALYAADTVIVPVGLSRWTGAAYQAIEKMLKKLKASTGSAPALLALPSIVSPGESIMLSEVPSWKSTKTPILRSAAIRNALNTGNPLKEGSIAEVWYKALADELVGVPQAVTQ